ncbi:MAG: DUF4271 domain-containing protein [Saprospiraceae bacterium]|nr:DUF4271 domain-containing protein [Bacteroidia bacterium]NNE16758.1 DUF4271 domain-containing protein [Saprospiraceae bacterium]NNL92327.1 DUF4271 domain-containing protein [Saprospiraceae bacterium]
MKHIIVISLFLLTTLPFLKGQTSNPFDVFHKNDTVPKAVIIEDVAPEASTKLEGENPFSISHIPIRKNQYRQIEQLHIQTDQKKENISIGYLPLWVIVLSLCFLAYILFNTKSFILNLLRSLSNDNFMRLTQYEQNGGRSIPFFLGYLLFLINFSLFLFLVINSVFMPLESSNYWLISLAVAVFFVGKHIAIAIVSWIFEFQKEAQLYDFTIITIRNLLAVFFLVLNILFVFGPEIWSKGLAVLGLIIFITFLMSRYYKGLRVGRKYVNSNFFHFFLYFCAFELSPWLITYKLVDGLV